MRHFGINEHTYLLLPPAVASSSSLLLAPVLLIGPEAVVVAEESDEAKEEEGAGIAGAAKKGLWTPLSCSGERHVGYDKREGEEEK